MQANDVSTIAVIGAGTMGTGIGGVFARAGCSVRLVDQTEDLLQRAERNLQSSQQVLQEAGLVSASEAAAALGRIQSTVDLAAACADVELVVEAITEDLAPKRQMFATLDRLCPPGAVLASNTSGLSITKIAQATRRPELVAGMHFWNPPHIIPLVEIIKGDATAGDTSQLLMAIASRLGKQPILVRRDVPGFVGNRLQYAVLREAFHILSEGIASAEDIDTAMTAGPGLRYGFLGPLETADLGGLDVFLAICEYLFAKLSSAPSPPGLLADLVEKGKLGAKTGEGFYRYSSADPGDFLAQRDRAFLGFLEVLGREQKSR